MTPELDDMFERSIMSRDLPSASSLHTVSDGGSSFFQQALKDALHVAEKRTPSPVFVYAGDAQQEEALDCQQGDPGRLRIARVAAQAREHGTVPLTIC